MIILVIALTVFFGLLIRPAIAHDNDLPVSHTGKSKP